MKTVDLLFSAEKHAAKVCEDYLLDMELDALSEILTERELSVLKEVLAAPLTDGKAISERQAILRDILKYPNTAVRLIELCEEVQNNRINVFGKYGRVSPERQVKESMRALEKTLQTPAEMFALLNGLDLKSETLRAFRDQLDTEEEIAEIWAWVTDTAGRLRSHSATFQLVYGDTFKMKSAMLFSGGKAREGLKSKFPFLKKTGGFFYGENLVLDRQVTAVVESGMTKLCTILSRINSHILSVCKTLSYQLTFYLAGVKIAEHLAAKGVPTTFPRVDKAQPGIFARKLYDLGLAIRRGGAQEVSPNDFDGEKDTFYLISGVNQGGKTTFVKSLGVAQLFAQNGLMVPAREYACPIYTGFVTHFPREEDENLYMGKLAEELTRFRKKLPLLIPAEGANGAFVVLNESFATTTEEEGAEIAAELLRALSEVKPALFFVTHNYLLLRGRTELAQRLAEGVSVASLISRGSAEGFKVVPGEPQENIHAFEYIQKYIAEQKAKAAASV